MLQMPSVRSGNRVLLMFTNILYKLSTILADLYFSPRRPCICEIIIITEAADTKADVTGADIKSTMNPAGRESHRFIRCKLRTRRRRIHIYIKKREMSYENLVDRDCDTSLNLICPLKIPCIQPGSTGAP